MSEDDDEDEALTWAGGRDPSHYETPETTARKRSAPARLSKLVAVDGATGAKHEDDDAIGSAPAASSVVLVSLGILGGIYALYTLGWIVSWRRLLYSDPDALELAAFHIQQLLAILAAPLWFVTTLLLTRGRRSAIRLVWLVVGALVLVPWSFTFGQ